MPDEAEKSDFNPETQCGKCKEEFTETDKKNTISWITCDVCQLWYHGKCVSLTATDIKTLTKIKAAKWYCDLCNNMASKIINQIVSLNSEQTKMKAEISALKDCLDNMKSDIEKIAKTKEKTNIELVKKVVQEELNEKDTPLSEEEIKEIIQKEIKSATDSSNQNNVDFPQLSPANYSKALKELATTELPKYVRNELSERDQIEKLKMNLIISGLPEKNSDETDMLEVKTLLEKELNINADISKTERLKKNNTQDIALLRVVFVTQQSRREVLKKAVELRKSINKNVREKIFIRPDLTKMQLTEQKNLRDQLKEMRAANPGKTYKITRNEVKEVQTPTTI